MSQPERPRRRPIPEEEAEEVAVAPPGHQVGPAIHQYLETSGLSKVIRLSAVLKVWDEVVDDDLRQHCRPVRFEGEDLAVAVDHQAFVTALVFRQRELLEQLGTALGERITGRLKAHVGSGFGLE